MRFKHWTIRLLVPGTVLGALIMGISSGLSGPAGASAPIGTDLPVAADFIGFPQATVQIEAVASRSGSTRSSSSNSNSSSSTGSSPAGTSSSGDGSSACGPESPCLNGKAVGRVLQQLLKQLNLTTTQTTQITTILQGERAAILKIIQALKASAGDSPPQDQLEAAKTQINALQLKDRAAIDKILTTDQEKQLTALEKQYCACNQGQSGSGSGGKSGGKGGKGSGGKCGDSAGKGSGDHGGGGSSSGGSTTATPTPTPSDTTST